MMVTFVSQCEKNALNKTRRVLDSFANRIGDKTWQTVITNEGLDAVKKLLRKTASKNTAVSCHWLRGRSRSELIWIVGNRQRFNSQGIVPVNTTEKTVAKWENDWHYLPLIKSLAALAALFHDWGKASGFFQEKLRPQNAKKIISDPLRHEWISVLFLNAFVNGDTDEQWLARLANGDIDEHALKEAVAKEIRNPLDRMPRAASLLGWLMMSHHRLPLPDSKENQGTYKGESCEDFEQLLALIKSSFGYENKREEDYQKKAGQCLAFPHGLPSGSDPWLKQAKKWAGKMLNCLPRLEQAISNGSWRLILHHARISLILGDHYYSSQEADAKWENKLDLFANTDGKSGEKKQKLDEHLIGVARHALSTAHSLPKIEGELRSAEGIKALKKISPGKYRWQDKAVDKIKAWKKALPEGQKEARQGFFLVNMAGTGWGKTFANAKIMQALSRDGGSLRYVLALGLRTLTLQTGDEYRDRIGLDYTELAVIIGSKAVMELHQHHKTEEEKSLEDNEMAGSESKETLLGEDILYDECPGSENALNAVLPDQKSRNLLYAPVLVCTIDHLMGATETKRGGRHILPSLRLMSSDLVIDEVDDFDGKDLIAIGRLVHLAGMLGRKVMISSATIPPDLAEGYFNAYLEGWRLFVKTRDASSKISCAWIDEFGSNNATISETQSMRAIENYRKEHSSFIEKRIKNLGNEKTRRKGKIIHCADIKAQRHSSEEDEKNIETAYFGAIQKAIIENHVLHKIFDEESRKQVSFGVARVANINPCVALAQYLAEAEWPKNMDVCVMAYHSRQVMLLRSEQEKHLDIVLKRNKNKNAPFADPIIRKHLSETKAENLVFIVVATPVEEIGRDHDFDWAVVEPSSYRSIIQLSGRVLRHRDHEPHDPNVAIMQYNLKGLKSSENKAVFLQPGYERHEKEYRFSSHDMTRLVDENAIKKGINAIPRIQKNKELRPNENFADLEHFSIKKSLTEYDSIGPEAMQGWLTQCWWLTALPQVFNRFREGNFQIKLFLVPDKKEFSFVEKVKDGRPEPAEGFYGISHKETPECANKRLWLNLDYKGLLEEQAKRLDISPMAAALRYGEISLPIYGENDLLNYTHEYSTQFGLIRLRDR